MLFLLFIFNRTVKIFRLLSKDTVEEAMFRCAQKKLTLEKDVTSCDAQNGQFSSSFFLLRIVS